MFKMSVSQARLLEDRGWHSPILYNCKIYGVIIQTRFSGYNVYYKLEKNMETSVNEDEQFELLHGTMVVSSKKKTPLLSCVIADLLRKMELLSITITGNCIIFLVRFMLRYQVIR